MEHCYGDCDQKQYLIGTIFGFSQQTFIKVSNTKFHENLSSGNHEDTRKQRNGWKDYSLMPLQLKTALLWQFYVTGNTKMYVGFSIKKIDRFS